MGSALASALRRAGADVRGPLGRGEAASGGDIVLLCVPDREIAAAASAIEPGPLVGHVSASAPLDLLAPHERLLDASAAQRRGRRRASSTARTARSTAAARPRSTQPARSRSCWGCGSGVVPRDQRALYHAAASVASNFLITLEGAAERLASLVGLERDALVPLVRATVDNWARQGARAALTGPIARGDVATATRQREAVADSAPELLPLWDALAAATRELAVAPATDAA